MKHFEIIQGTEEWHRIRWGKIGGTLAKGLFVNSDTLMYDVLSEKTEDYYDCEDSFVSEVMLRGVELEPVAKQRLIEHLGIIFLNCGWVQSEIEILGISPDGISECGKFSCEIKCPQAKKHIQTIIEGEIPQDNIHQCLHYFTVMPELERHYFVSFRPESIKQLFIYELTQDSFINIGTKAKPKLLTVRELAHQAREEAIKLENQINQIINQLNF